MLFKKTDTGILKEKTILKRVFIFTVSLFLIILLAPVLANDRPLICKYKNHWLFPAISLKNEINISSTEVLTYRMGSGWKTLETDFFLFPLIPYSPNTIDPQNSLKGLFDVQYLSLAENEMIEMPLKYRHWLGTTQNGTDVLSGIIHGARTSLLVGFCSMFISGILGILLGALAGYYGNTNFKMGFAQSIGMLLGMILSVFYVTIVSEWIQVEEARYIFFVLLILIILFAIPYLFSLLGKKLDTLIRIKKQITLPFDSIVTKLIELLNTIPSLLLIIAIAALSKPSYTLLVITISLLSWTTVARLTRAEFFKAKELNYVQAYIVMGMKPHQIIFQKILPNVFTVLFVQLLFIFSMAIIIESSLSFIGIAVPHNNSSWGALMGEAREDFKAWWLVIFPGTCIFLMTYFIHKIQMKF